MRTWVTSILVLSAGVAAAADTGSDFFEKKVRPVLVANCYQCHSASAKELQGKLRLDTKEGIRKGGETGPAIVPGKPDESPLYEKIQVNGRRTHPLYQYLKRSQGGLLRSRAIKWNFTKFLINRRGEVVRRFSPRTEPSALEGPIAVLLDEPVLPAA